MRGTISLWLVPWIQAGFIVVCLRGSQGYETTDETHGHTKLNQKLVILGSEA